MMPMNAPIQPEPVYTLQVIDDARLFAGFNGGLFSSADGGASWQYAYRSLVGDAPLATVSLLVHRPEQGAPALYAGVAGGIMSSYDGGHAWQATRLPEPEPLVTALAVSPQFDEDGILFAATAEDGVFISTDRGVTWAVWNFGLLDPNVLSLAVSPDFTHSGLVFAGVSSGLFRSHNRGRSWQPIALPCGYDAVLSLALSPLFDQDGLGFLGSEEHGVLHTRDGGETWQVTANRRLEGPVNSLVLGQDGQLLALVDTQLMVSSDAAESWQPWSSAPEAVEITAFSAPQGIGRGLPVWIGTADGQVLRIS
jgi:photosystem II stability/assembly factor-like uncharacterized protein